MRVDTVVISTQHAPRSSARDDIEAAIIEHVIKPVIDAAPARREDHAIYINPTGRFVIGGPYGDSGLTGRKIIVDTYGGMAPARRRRLQRQGPDQGRPLGRLRGPLGRQERRRRRAGRRCEVQLAYAIGVAEPVSIDVETFGTETVADEKHRARDRARPSICARRRSSRDLDLRRPIYQQTAAYGHFGRTDIDLTWERTDKAVLLRANAGLKGTPGPANERAGV